MEKNIIVIDDDQFICQSLEILLSECGNIHIFNTIATAEEFINNNRTDLIILDYNIGSENGVKFYKEKISNDIPAILISGFIVTELKTKEELETMNNLFIKVYEKPFDIMMIKEFITKTLAT